MLSLPVSSRVLVFSGPGHDPPITIPTPSVCKIPPPAKPGRQTGEKIYTTSVMILPLSTAVNPAPLWLNYWPFYKVFVSGEKYFSITVVF